MPQISVTARKGDPSDTAVDTRVVGLFDGESSPESVAVAGEAKGAWQKLAVGTEDGRSVILIGLGKREEWDAERARVAAALTAGRASELGATGISWAVPEGEGVAEGIVEGTLLKLYKFDRFKSKGEDDEPAGVESLELASAEHEFEIEARTARITAEAANAARNLQNLPANVANPAFLAARAQEIADEHAALDLQVFDRDQIVEMGMGAFAAVAQGTHTDPKLIVMRYSPEGAKGPHLGYVGKAVTFDTGGISIKPSGKMQEMKFDMSGGAAVIESMDAIAQLGLPVRITAVVPATDNMPSGRAVKPGDIVTAMNGKTIEVNNTDAEGRLILADALAYAVQEGAERLIDLATLTGAIIVALGSTYSGLFSNDDDWCEEVEAAGEQSGEIGWRLPLHPEYFELTKGQYADLTNASDTRKAMSIYAAEFLRQFVDERPWVHVDIAGTAWGGTRPYVGGGASGYGVRMLTALARRAAR
ncbi:MAG: leucyl aminopeptidase [Thermoleophilaceae bacterium]|nr:leucyl aminopeptidase [Thermoleophilaceae bacterium]